MEFETGLVPNLDEHSVSTASVPVQQYSIARYREMRTINPSHKYGEADLVAYALSVADNIESSEEPSTYEEAVSCSDSCKWMIFMQENMESLHKNGTWDMARLPKEKKVIRYKWVFKKKEGTPSIENARYKARLVTKGYNQIPGVDFTNVFSPMVKHRSFQYLLGIVALHDYEREQLDVKTAFLHGDLEEDIYLQQPEGFTVSGKEDYNLLLKNSFYGLKQSPIQWYEIFESFMISHDFKRTSFDSCVYFKQCNDESFLYMLLYVDDMLIATRSKENIRSVKAQLNNEFEMKDLGAGKKILGIEILRDRVAGRLSPS